MDSFRSRRLSVPVDGVMWSRHTMTGRGSTSISAQDLLKLVKDNDKNGFLRQKCVQRVLKTTKWKHRFIVLATSGIYAFENEMSRSALFSVSLLGYIGVERETSSTCAWVFALVPSLVSLKRLSFACSNDAERKEWMHRIKEHLYVANDIKERSLPSEFFEKLKLHEGKLTPDEEEYLELECPVISPEKLSPGDSDKKTEDISDSDDSDSGVPVEKSIPSKSKFQKKKKDEGEKKRNCSDVALPDFQTPPRYSAVIDGTERVYVNGDVAADSAPVPGARRLDLEKKCLITDEELCRDRDKCIAKLKESYCLGTYLIRKSRTADYKVLSILTDDDLVKEFRIEEEYGMFHFFHDKSYEFPSVEDMLVYYTSFRKVPVANTFLCWGIHEYLENEANKQYDEL